MGNKDQCIFFDLDGTLTSVNRRYAKVLEDVATTLGFKEKINYSQYYKFQRRGLSGVEILTKILGNKELAQASDKMRIERLVEPCMRQLDTLLPRVKESLDKLGRQYEIIVITVDKLLPHIIQEQLESLSVAHKVDRIYSAYDYRRSGLKPESIKAKIITQHIQLARSDLQRSFVVGDAETDVRAAKICKLISVAVLTGIRGKRFLEHEKADIIVKDVSKIPDALDSIKRLKFKEMNRTLA
jgi:phosphoglycolate phosphatase-like HAD superfamily hydrolase